MPASGTVALRVLRSACLLLLCPLLIEAQGDALPTDWRAVKAIPPDSRIEATLHGGKKLKGRFAAASDDTLTLSRGGRTVDLDRRDISRLFQRVPASKVRRLALGAAIGGGIGLGVGGYAYSRGDFIKAVIPGMGLIGAGTGAVIGLAASLRHRSVLVYAAPRSTAPAVSPGR